MSRRIDNGAITDRLVTALDDVPSDSRRGKSNRFSHQPYSTFPKPTGLQARVGARSKTRSICSVHLHISKCRFDKLSQVKRHGSQSVRKFLCVSQLGMRASRDCASISYRRPMLATGVGAKDCRIFRSFQQEPPGKFYSADCSSTGAAVRRRRRLIFMLLHSLVIVSKTSGDSYLTIFLPSGIGPIRPRNTGMPRRAKSALLSSTPIWLCKRSIESGDGKSRILSEPSLPRVTIR